LILEDVTLVVYHNSNRKWYKTSGKVGAKPLELPAAAVEIIKALPRQDGNPWVFPGGKEGEHLTKGGMYHTWVKVRNMAGVPDLRQHDFRSFAASEGLNQGISLQIAATVLGHKDSRTTERHYQKPRRRATSEAAEKIFAPVAKAFGLAQDKEDEGS
jgi:integrase